MAKQSVIDMLKKPVMHRPEPQRGGLIAVLENELSEMAMDNIRKKAMNSAHEELAPQITEAQERAVKAESELAETKSALAKLQASLSSLSSSHHAEQSAKDAANKAYEESHEQHRKLETQVSQLSGRLVELERHNISLQASLSTMTSEIGKQKQGFSLFQKPQKQDLDLEVTSRGLKGEIKTVSIKPKR